MEDGVYKKKQEIFGQRGGIYFVHLFWVVMPPLLAVSKCRRFPTLTKNSNSEEVNPLP